MTIVENDAGEAPGPDLTRDAFLGGRVMVLQPARRGHRAGFDAVMLAASLPEGATGTVADLGAGVGVAGLCLAARLAVDVVFVERDSETFDLLRRNLAANAGIGGRFTAIRADVTAKGAERAAAGLTAGLADHVVMNPPFHPAERGRPSPDAARAEAHRAAEGDLDAWVRAAASILAPSGTLTLIHRADAIAAVIEALGRRFGAIDLLPLHARAGAPAHRLIARARLGSRGPLALLQGLVVHNADGAYRPEVDAVLRGGAALAAGWRR